MILKNLYAYADLFSEYTELRVQENRSIRISMVKGNIVENSRTSTSGVSARVYKDGVWGFASHPNISDNTMKMVMKSAIDNALFLSFREKKEGRRLPVVNAVAEHDFTTGKKRISQREMLAFIREIDNYITGRCSRLNSRSIILSCLDMEKSLITSDVSTAYSMIPRTLLSILLSTERDGEPVELFEVHGGFGQFEDVFLSPDQLYGKVDRQYDHLLKKAEGIYPRAGLADCILDADLAGILAHEAIGHTTEADLVLGGSIASEYLNEQIADPLITLVDFAHSALDERCPVPVYIDDEGTKAEDALIIEAGILKEFLHNKETANHFGMIPKGNARAFQFSDEPLIRMRNTAILPGRSKLEDMIASIDDGYYLMKASNGQADSTSEFMFGIILGYEIKKGKIGRALRDTTISGVAFDVLKTVRMVSDQMVWSNSGMCGKKQLIPVGLGGPAIQCVLHIGGK